MNGRADSLRTRIYLSHPKASHLATLLLETFPASANLGRGIAAGPCWRRVGDGLCADRDQIHFDNDLRCECHGPAHLPLGHHAAGYRVSCRVLSSRSAGHARGSDGGPAA